MTVDVIYKCGGCDNRATVHRLKKTWRTIRQGTALDLCEVRTPTIEGTTPAGWIAFDPYTGVCYCPVCWAEMQEGASV